MSTLTPTRAQRRRRLGLAGALATVLAISAVAVALLPAGAANEATSSITRSGSGPFASLKVTVAKTKALVGEAVEVSWTGGTPTVPDNDARLHYLQIMQCWGDDPKGPEREQCQFGSLVDPLGIAAGPYQRLLEYGQVGEDSAETLTGEYVPFQPVGGDPIPGEPGELGRYFDPNTTNEIPVARTRGDGTGREFFEVQTATEAPGLGCGQLVEKEGESAQPRHCWLVVVPRSATEVDGTLRDETFSTNPQQQRLQSSPLAASNWAQRVVFPLEFLPLGNSCALDGNQTQLLGSEMATEAVSRWQPALCDAANSVFAFSQVPDAAGRANIASGDPVLSILGAPPAEVRGTTPLVAPVAVSGIGFSYLIQAQSRPDSPPEVLARTGSRIEDIKLTPRLVAKMLTQSYLRGSAKPVSEMAGNPPTLENDPEFLQLNPVFEEATNRSTPGVQVERLIMPIGQADAYRLVWTWITADREAREFLDGEPDPSGMVINPAWRGFDPSDAADFAQLDQSCRPESGLGGEWCPADAFPYTTDMHEGTRAASRGDSLAKTLWTPLAAIPAYKKPNPQPQGRRAVMAISDSATAARYALPMAKLRNASGEFVGPDTTNLLAAVNAMKPTQNPAVMEPDPTAATADAYPLTTISYAATMPAGLSADERQAYAGFLRYAGGPGQAPGVRPGQLPAGYAPLPTSLADRTVAAAEELLQFREASAPTPTPTPVGDDGAADNETDDVDRGDVGSGEDTTGNGDDRSDGGTGGRGPGGGSRGDGAGTGGSDSSGNGAGSGGGGGDASGADDSGDTGDSGGVDGDGSMPGAPGQNPDDPAASPPVPPPAEEPQGPVRAAISAITPDLTTGKGRLILLWLLLSGLLAGAAAQAVPRIQASQRASGIRRPHDHAMPPAGSPPPGGGPGTATGSSDAGSPAERG